MSDCISFINYNPRKFRGADYLKSFLIATIFISWVLAFLSISYVCIKEFRDSTSFQSAPQYGAQVKSDMLQNPQKLETNEFEAKTIKVKFEGISNEAGLADDTKQKLRKRTLSTRRMARQISTEALGQAQEDMGNKQTSRSSIFGEIRSLALEMACLDASAIEKSKVSTFGCHGLGGNQEWLLNEQGELKRENLCADYFGGPILLLECHGSKGNQMWDYDYKTQTLRHVNSESCITVTQSGSTDMVSCEQAKKWKWGPGRYNLHANNNNYNEL